MLSTAACGGGGGEGGLSSPAPLAPKRPATDFSNDPEFDPCYTDGVNDYCVYGLSQIGAQYAYAEGATGAGVVVAVVDTGIDATHEELNANVSVQSKDIANGAPISDMVGHGTFVAGIIAAEKNGFGFHGVAFGAKILAIRVDTVSTDAVACSPDPPPCSLLFDSDIAAGITYATGRAHIINLSLGGPSPSPEMEQPLIDAAAAGAIIVVSTGNESLPGSPALDPLWPAAYAGDTGVGGVNESGQIIAVGAVDSAGNLAVFSNQCGAAMDFCLVAPGVDIISTMPNQKVGLASGTSFAAPHVSGAAALLIQLWPTLLPAEVVQIMLTSATDLGAVGVDPVYGHGLLNLGAAVLPAGTLAVPLTSLAGGDLVALDGTALSLGSAFGDALTGSSLLGQAFALDDYDRNFSVDLNDSVTHASRGFGLSALLGGGSLETVDAELPNGIKIAMGVSDEDEVVDAADWAGMAGEEGEEQKLHGMSLAIESDLGVGLRIGYDVTPEQQMAGLAASEAAGLFWMPGDLLGPQYGLVDAGVGISLSHRLDASSTLSLGWVDQKDGADLSGQDAKTGEIRLIHRFGNGMVGYAGFSTVDEQGGFLGSDGVGGFAVNGADTQFYSLGGRYAMGAGLEVIGNYTLGEANMRADGSGLLSDWSEIRAEAFGVGLVKNGILSSRDRIGLLAGQPLRVSSGAVTVTAPVDYLLDKTVVLDSERVSMTPSGREIDLQLAYDTALGDAANLSGWLMMQLEPGHVANADPAYGIGIRFSAGF